MGRSAIIALTATADTGDVPESIATVVHELKTPLTSMVGYTRLLRAGWERMSPSRRDDCFDVIEKQAERLTGMLEDLLHAARFRHDDAPPRRTRIDLPRMLAAIVRETAMGEHSGRFRIESPREDLRLYGDASALRHALTNLIDNALKYSPPASPIDVTIQAREGEVLIGVANDGAGIHDDDLPHVFDRFHRGGAAAGPGSGLGLYIVKSLVEAHDGTVSVRSGPNGRTTFTVALPRRASRD